MKKLNFYTIVVLLILCMSATARAQQGELGDQNPRYEISRQHYMGMADSLNGWHSTTIQDTYRAIDFLADKRDARLQRQAFRRELRLERARNGYGWYNDYPYYPSNGYGYRNNYGYNSSYYGRSYRNNYYRSSFLFSFGPAWYWR